MSAITDSIQLRIFFLTSFLWFYHLTKRICGSMVLIFNETEKVIFYEIRRCMVTKTPYYPRYFVNNYKQEPIYFIQQHGKTFFNSEHHWNVEFLFINTSWEQSQISRKIQLKKKMKSLLSTFYLLLVKK